MLNHLRVRIAVSEAAAWTGRRFFGGRYRIIPNGVDLAAAHAAPDPVPHHDGERRPLRIAFVGQAVERKGLPVLLRAFEALREHIPAELTIVGAEGEDIDQVVLDDARHLRARQGLRRSEVGRAARRRRAVRAVAGRRVLRHGADRGLRGRHAGRRL